MLLLLLGCEAKTVVIDPIEDLEDLEAACEEGTPEDVTVSVSFAETASPDCGWGEGGNLEALDAHVTARVEESDAISVPDGAVVCDATFDFAVDPEGDGSIMRYDDGFFFAFDDVLLSSSHADLVALLPTEDDLVVWDWDALAGTGLDFGEVPTWCLGEEEGRATCDIPPPETPGEMALDFDADLVAELSLRAIEQDRMEFTFITFGDNDAATDCSHNAFSFETTLTYVER